MRIVYARPEYIETLETSTAIAEHVPVDFELRVSDRPGQLLEVVGAFLNGTDPRSRTTACASSASGAEPSA